MQEGWLFNLLKLIRLPFLTPPYASVAEKQAGSQGVQPLQARYTFLFPSFGGLLALTTPAIL